MSQEVMIAGALFSDVPSIRVPDSQGNFHPFTDTSDADATAEDIAQGKTAYVDGVKIVGAFQPAEPIETEALTVTENGVYTASSGHAYTPVTVNVAGGGGISVDDIALRTISGVVSGEANVVGDHAFYGCEKLRGADFPNADTIYPYAFFGCYSLSSISFPQCGNIQSHAFEYCSSLTAVSFPLVSRVGVAAFSRCTRLTDALFDNASSVGNSMFMSCYSLNNVSFPRATQIGGSAFYSCSNLSVVSFSGLTAIGQQAFRACYNLIELHLENQSTVPTLGNSVFYYTPIGNYSISARRYGSVFVPASLYESFLTAGNWSNIASRIVSV